MTATRRLSVIEKQMSERLGDDGLCICPPERLHCFFTWPDEPNRAPLPDNPGPCPRCGGGMHIWEVTRADVLEMEEKIRREDGYDSLSADEGYREGAG